MKYYPNFKENYELFAIGLCKQQELDADPRAIKQINFTGNLERDENENTTIVFIITEAKGTVLDNSQEP